MTATTTKHWPTALAITPTAGTTMTVMRMGNPSPDATNYEFAEETVTSHPATVQIRSTRERTKTSADGTVTVTPGVTRIVETEWVIGGDGKFYPIVFNLGITHDVTQVTAAQLQACYWKFLVLAGSSDFVNAVNRRKIGLVEA